MKRNFNEWLNTFRESIATWRYYTDFEKVYANTDEIKDELNLLNRISENCREIPECTESHTDSDCKT